MALLKKLEFYHRDTEILNLKINFLTCKVNFS